MGGVRPEGGAGGGDDTGHVEGGPGTGAGAEYQGLKWKLISAEKASTKSEI